MRSLLLILSWGSVLFYSTIIAQSISLLDFDSADDQPPLEDFLAFQDSIPLTDTAVSDLDLEDPSFFTDVGTDNISDSDDFSLLDPSILKASCSDENETQPSKLKPRGAPAACDNPALSNQISDPSNLPTSFTGDTVGALSADGYWCYDPQFPLIHPIPVCDQLYPGADPIRPLHDLPEWVFRDSPYHHAVYPGRVSKFPAEPPLLLALLDASSPLPSPLLSSLFSNQ